MSTFGDIRFVSRAGERRYSNPVEVCVAHGRADVLPALRRVALGVSRGLHAAGYVAYEAAGAFDPALACYARPAVPLLWFGLFEEAQVGSAEKVRSPHEVGLWEPGVARPEYLDILARIRETIASGDTYQVNYVFPLRASFRGSPVAWFYDLCEAQQADYCAYLHLGRHHIVSVSPELFFSLEDGVLRTRPMKGTRPRGRFMEEDRVLSHDLRRSAKDQAENVMIVDLLRNDMGRISETGSVQVERLFDVERYPTLWQMTSTIVSRTSAQVPEILTALFPSGSVTGAPKIRTTEIIREVEAEPRGVYCGTIGWWEPSGRAVFNVAIRTATVDSETETAVYPVGSGVTWDSVPEGEYAECLTKAAVVTFPKPRFDLMESFLYDGRYFLLDRHLDRLEDSAGYFGFRCDRKGIARALLEAAGTFSPSPQKVRLLLARDGTWRIEVEPAPPPRTIRLGLARHAVDAAEIFLFHKTTHRMVYERARMSRPDCDDVLLWNDRDEITESAIANVVVDLDGTLITPPVTCGLLAGTFRAELLEEGALCEGIITKADLRRCRSIRLINSVRQWIPVHWVPEPVRYSEPVHA